jgi:xylan 1,4-beta-xylosidase
MIPSLRSPRLAFASLAALLLASPARPEPRQGGGPVLIRVDAAQREGEMRPIWRFFGYDEPNYTYMKDGQKLLSELAALSPDPVYVRVHNLLTSGDGTPALKWGSTGAYSEDAEGRPVYNWTIVDRIVDTYLERGMRPYMQIGFMPEALSTHPKPYQHEWKPAGKASISTGWAYPPRDYAKWSELVFQWVKHSVEKYGQGEVETWYWELWNEPNILYWRGTPEEYHKMYDFAVEGVRRALPTAKVGGPHVAGGGSEGGMKFSKGFFEHCLRGTNHATGRVGTPIDFVAFHAKGVPSVVDGHVRMGISNQLRDIDGGFSVIASFPELKDKPIVIGESDPDGCAACPASLYPQNAYRNSTLYASYTAATFARKYKLADLRGVNLLGAVTWAFEFEGQPYFAGFRVLSTNGVDLPVLNVFRMLGLMRGERVNVESSGEVSLDAIKRSGVRGENPDISALASLGEGELSVLVWNYHDDDKPAPPGAVELALDHLPMADGKVLLHHYRIDGDHSNAFEAWKAMGSPAKPTAEQQDKLVEAGQLALMGSPEWVKVEAGKAAIKLSLPRQSVSLLRFNWKPGGSTR